MKTQTTETIPPQVWEHLSIACRRMSRRFRLDADAAAELLAHVRERVLTAVAHGYRPERGKVSTYAQRVIRNVLAEWARKEFLRRNDRLAMACAAAACAARRARAGAAATVDDTTYAPEERWSHGEESPAERAGDDTPWDPFGLRRAVCIACVRRAVERLCGDSRCLLRQYLRAETLTEAFGRFRCVRPGGPVSTRRFYGEIWPQAKADFRQAYLDEVNDLAFEL